MDVLMGKPLYFRGKIVVSLAATARDFVHKNQRGADRRDDKYIRWRSGRCEVAVCILSKNLDLETGGPTRTISFEQIEAKTSSVAGLSRVC